MDQEKQVQGKFWEIKILEEFEYCGKFIFATGTPDKFLYAYDSKSGEKIWEYQLPFAGSSSPMTYYYEGEQYILVNSGGGKFFGYDENLGDQMIAFKLN